MTTRQLSAELYGQGLESAGAETDFWAALPSLSAEAVERIVRRAALGSRFEIIASALKGSAPERTAELKARFTPAELQEMLSNR